MKWKETKKDCVVQLVFFHKIHSYIALEFPFPTLSSLLDFLIEEKFVPPSL